MRIPRRRPQKSGFPSPKIAQTAGAEVADANFAVDAQSLMDALLLGGGSPTMSRRIFLMGDVTERHIHHVIEQIFVLSELDMLDPITLVVSTYGGSLDDAMALHDAMRIVKTPIHTVGIGKVMSAGCLILASGTKGERSITKNTCFMYHGASSGTSGDVFEQENDLIEFKRLQRNFDHIIAAETKKSLKQVETLRKSRLDKFMTPAEVVKFGFADKVV